MLTSIHFIRIELDILATRDWFEITLKLLLTDKPHVSQRRKPFSPDALSLLEAEDLDLGETPSGAANALGLAKEIRRFEENPEPIGPVIVSGDGKFYLTTDAHFIVRLWDSAHEFEIRRFSGHSENVRHMSFSPNGKFLFTGADDGTARIWEIASGEGVETI